METLEGFVSKAVTFNEAYEVRAFIKKCGSSLSELLKYQKRNEDFPNLSEILLLWNDADKIYIRQIMIIKQYQIVNDMTNGACWHLPKLTCIWCKLTISVNEYDVRWVYMDVNVLVWWVEYIWMSMSWYGEMIMIKIDCWGSTWSLLALAYSPSSTYNSWIPTAPSCWSCSIKHYFTALTYSHLAGEPSSKNQSCASFYRYTFHPGRHPSFP